MRVFAIHDTAGNISEVVTAPEYLPQPVLTMQPGLTMTEIEDPASVVDIDLESEIEQESLQVLAQLVESHRVQVGPTKSTLVTR